MISQLTNKKKMIYYKQNLYTKLMPDPKFTFPIDQIK